MDKRLEFLIKEVERLDFSIENEYDNVYRIGNYSPCGQDCSASIDTENDPRMFIRNIREFVRDYDVNYETSLWLDEFGHGINGAPYDMKDIYEDMQWWKDSLEELVNDLEKVLNEYDF